MHNTLEKNNINNSSLFYAKIEKISTYNGNTSLIVQGSSINSINYREKFCLSITKNTIITHNGKKIEIADLNVEDDISIIFDGNVYETSPAQILNVFEIQLLKN